MKVLIAEDDIHIRSGLKDMLLGEGYAVVEAADGLQALALFETTAPDLVLLDIMMPGMDGYSVCREIQRKSPDTPIMFISAKSEEIDQVLGLELGADDFIAKPFGVREVLARIRAVTRRTIQLRARLKAQSGEPAVVEIFELGALTVLPGELRAKREGRAIDLSLREISILRLLSERRGQVIDRETFFNICWGYDHMPNSRTLDQQISKLRKRIERDPKQPEIIRTVHGVGYRFDG